MDAQCKFRINVKQLNCIIIFSDDVRQFIKCLRNTYLICGSNLLYQRTTLSMYLYNELDSLLADVNSLMMGYYEYMHKCLGKVTFNPCHAEYFMYFMHPIFILLTCAIPNISTCMYLQSEKYSVDPEDIASSEAS